MGVNSIKAVGGQMSISKMTNKVEEKEYAIRKAYAWMNMLNDKMYPTKWLKANKNGTKVNFNAIHSQEDYEKGLDELEAYLKGLNREFGTYFKIKRDKE